MGILKCSAWYPILYCHQRLSKFLKYTRSTLELSLDAHNGYIPLECKFPCAYASKTHEITCSHVHFRGVYTGICILVHLLQFNHLKLSFGAPSRVAWIRAWSEKVDWRMLLLILSYSNLHVQAIVAFDNCTTCTLNSSIISGCIEGAFSIGSSYWVVC